MTVGESACAQMEREVTEILIDPITSKSYRRDELLGQGAFGKCYKMTELVSGDSFAVKVIPLYSWGLEEVCQEVQILKRLRHKNVVGFSHSFADRQFMYIFMELCSKQTLGDILIARGTLTEPEVRYYMRQLMSGLKYIHDQGYVHRDIKLDNLFVNDKMELKIGDFGLATKLEPREKTVLGTPCNMAPEVWKREGHGTESEVWALGCVMYQLLVGEMPFYDDDYWEMIENIKGAKYVPSPNLSVAAGELLAKIFQINPQDRPSLQKIRRHKYFTKGFTPKRLPASSIDTVPKQVKAVKNPIVRFFNRLARRLFPKERSVKERVEPSWEDAMSSSVQVPQSVKLPVVRAKDRPMSNLYWCSWLNLNWSQWLRDH